MCGFNDVLDEQNVQIFSIAAYLVELIYFLSFNSCYKDVGMLKEHTVKDYTAGVHSDWFRLNNQLSHLSIFSLHLFSSFRRI